MLTERIQGFILALDSVHGKPTWKVRVDQPGHEFHGRKCRVESIRDWYEPKKSDVVMFVLGSTVEGGNRILQAYDVSPIVERENVKAIQLGNEQSLNWIMVECGDEEVYVSAVGLDSHEEAQNQLNQASGGDEKVIAFVSFDPREHANKWSDPDLEDAFGVIRSLTVLDSTRDAFEKMITTIVREALRQRA